MRLLYGLYVSILIFGYQIDFSVALICTGCRRIPTTYGAISGLAPGDLLLEGFGAGGGTASTSAFSSSGTQAVD